MQLVKSLSTELKIAQLDVAGPDTDVELLWVEVLDIHAQEPVQQVGNEALEHGGNERPLPRSGAVSR